MPKSENIDRLGSIAFILGNKELPSEISKQDYQNYKSIFSDETIHSGSSLIDTKISKDDQALAELQANDSGVSDSIQKDNSERRRGIEEELKKELSKDNEKETLIKPEDILSTLSNEDREDIVNTKKQEPAKEEIKKVEKPKKETKAQKLAREKEEKLEKDKIKKTTALKDKKEKKELDDLDALLGSLDDILNEDIFDDDIPAMDRVGNEEEKEIVEDVKEDEIKDIPQVTDNKADNEEEIPIDEVVVEENGEDEHIEVDVDDIDNDTVADDKLAENVIPDNADKPTTDDIIATPKDIELTDDKVELSKDDLDIDDIALNIEPLKAVNEIYTDDVHELDDLDTILEEFNVAVHPKSPEELEKELDEEIAAMPKEEDEVSIDIPQAIEDTDDIDSMLEEFDNVVSEPEKAELPEEVLDIEDEMPEDKLDEEQAIEDDADIKEEDSLSIPSLDEIENEVEDMIASGVDEKQLDDVYDEELAHYSAEETNSDDDSLIQEAYNEPEEDNVLPPPDTEFETSKYGNLSAKYNNDKILNAIEKLPEGIQFSVLDAILNETLSKKDMDNLLSLLEKKASAHKISNLLSGHAITPKHVIDNTKKAIQLIPVPDSLKEYAGIIRYAAVFVVALIAISILGYQFVYKPLRANSYFATGLEAIEKGNYDTGELNFNRGDRLKPKQISWFNKYANAYMDKERFDDAYNKVNMSLKISPTDFESNIVLGDYYRRRAENDIDDTLYASGEKLYGDMLASENNNKKKSTILDKRGLLMMSRANTLHQDIYLKNAYDNYQTMLQVDGDTPFVRKRMMQIRIYQDDYEQVKLLRTYINTIKKGYFDNDVYPMLAKYLLYKDDFHSARTIFEDVLKKHRDSIPAIVGYAEYETRLKHYEKARNILVNAALPLYEERGIKKGKEFVYNLLGQIYYNLSQYGNATREFLNALAINPVYPDANYNLGNVYYYQENNYEKAKMYYENAYSNSPKELHGERLVYNLSWIHYLDKEYDRAFEGFLTLFNKESDNVVVSYALANSLMHLDKDTLARGFYNNALNHVLEKRSKLGKLAMRTEKEYMLMNYMASLYNNLGVSHAYTYTRDRGVVDEQEAFKNFVLASQYFDQIRTANIELQVMEKRTVNLGSQNIAIPTYNIMTMQTRRNLKQNLAIDDYIPKIMNSLK